MMTTSATTPWNRARCGAGVDLKNPAIPGSPEELAEEIRQLRATVAVYRRIAEKLMEERRK
jgi:hypothetical protein